MPAKKKSAKPAVVEPETESTETVEASAPVPNVQAEAGHGSVAAEDVRDAQVAEPNT